MQSNNKRAIKSFVNLLHKQRRRTNSSGLNSKLLPCSNNSVIDIF